MKKGFCITVLLLVGILGFNTNVSASSYYFTNSYGVKFTHEEYEFVSLMYWEGYQDLMTEEDYIAFINSNVMESDFEVKESYYNPMQSRGAIFTDSARSLKIFKSCSTDCLISVTLNWTKSPNVRSYDVIGAYISGTTFTNSPTTVVASSTSRQSISDLKKTTNGIGSSFLLPSGTNININQVFRVKTGGKVFASYQHAMRTSSLAKSKNYTFSNIGYGRVFNFQGDSRDIYDGMTGVDITT